MPCPASREPNGFHKYQLAGAGLEFPGVCSYCGQPKTFRPFDGEQSIWSSRHAKGTAAANAAKRAKRASADAGTLAP
jgi:hypothetical protein